MEAYQSLKISFVFLASLPHHQLFSSNQETLILIGNSGQDGNTSRRFKDSCGNEFNLFVAFVKIISLHVLVQNVLQNKI